MSEPNKRADTIVLFLLEKYGEAGIGDAVTVAVLVLAKLGRGVNIKSGRSVEDFIAQVEYSLRTLFELPRGANPLDKEDN